MATFPTNGEPETNGHVIPSQVGVISRDGVSDNHLQSQLATVYVVDSDAEALSSTIALLDRTGLNSQGYFDAESFLRSRRRTDTGCVLLELELREKSGIDVQARLVERGINLPVIFLATNADIPATVKAMKAGALNVLEKPVDAQLLADQVQLAIQLDAQSRKTNDGIDLLSGREFEVMTLLLQARSTKGVAHDLSISAKTVEKHRANVLRKLQCDSVTELVIKLLPLQRRLSRGTGER